MALNWTMLSEHRTPVPLPNEGTVSKEPDVEITLKIPDAPPSRDATSGGSGGAGKTLKSTGTIWLSNQRVPTPGSTDRIESLSIPWHLIVSTKFEQPFFSANYLKLEVYPVPDGGLHPGTVVEVRFRDRGMFSWVELLVRTREEAIVRRRETRMREGLGEDLRELAFCLWRGLDDRGLALAHPPPFSVGW
ncbi:hypothetical protein M407DRAFT_79657 [Tulasnella calospora MUT 4182]|uniref:Uncharacterized protein n=1 Tax=Tulasnella calospora MUT 4182 TaxID=1051891 RepID=A0A0C3QC10_9AGAM|nr:hypothetical protein M407DRAFT_79657 [Tulasnella calospora MUT 4182]